MKHLLGADYMGVDEVVSKNAENGNLLATG